MTLAVWIAASLVLNAIQYSAPFAGLKRETLNKPGFSESPRITCRLRASAGCARRRRTSRAISR
jgi:hypothetical protein